MCSFWVHWWVIPLMEDSAITPSPTGIGTKATAWEERSVISRPLLEGRLFTFLPMGKCPAQTADNMSRWKGWWKLLNIDQWGVFYFGAMIGMFLPGILYVGVLPRGQTLPAWGIAASSASGLILKLGNFGWFLALFFGFWILYSTAISNVDLVVRQSTDMLWFSSERVRKFAKMDIRKVYYPLLVIFVAWGVTYMNTTAPLIILAISANIANFTMALSAVATIRLNRKFLPKEYRPALWREVDSYRQFLLLWVLLFSFLLGKDFEYQILRFEGTVNM